jgi:hypothetical protein
MARFRGQLVKDDDGQLCIKMTLGSQSSMIEDIPLEELLEEFIGKNIIMDVFPLSNRVVGNE